MTQPHGRAVVVMGVSGSGKTTVAELLAKRLGWAFAEGDRLHPPANVEKMRQGIPLDRRGPRALARPDRRRACGLGAA